MAAPTSPAIMPTYVMQAFVKLCTRYGIPTSHKVLAVTQLGPIPMKGEGYLAHSYKAYSLARKGIKVKLSLPLKDLPLWHSTVFCDKHHTTYFAPHLIRQGVLTVAQLFDSSHALTHAPMYLTLMAFHLPAGTTAISGTPYKRLVPASYMARLLGEVLLFGIHNAFQEDTSSCKARRLEGFLACKPTPQPERFCISVHVAQTQSTALPGTMLTNLCLPLVWSVGNCVPRLA